MTQHENESLVMIAGKTLTEISKQILEQNNHKRDYISDTRKLTMTPRGNIACELKGETREYVPTELCIGQIGDRVGIPRKYVERMRTQAPELLAKNVNHWFQQNPENRMLRTLDNGSKIARAFLSNRYRPLDNDDLANAILPRLAKAGCEVKSAQITETRLYIQAVTPRLEALIQRRRNEAKPGEHNVGAINDIVQAGVVISNSEVGCGSIKVEPMIFRMVCRNGLITQTGLKRAHVGRAGEGNIDADADTFEMFSDETRKLDDKAFWNKVCDVVDASLDRIKFEKTVAKLNEATGEDLGNKPTEIVEVTAGHFGMNDGEKESVLNHLSRGGDLSKFGLIQAVTRTAEDLTDYDRAVDFERFGGAILELPASDFRVN